MPITARVALAALTVAAALSTAQDEFTAQHPEDRLDGQITAVCYSGFRAGQHPDRGDGAVNPSDADILEDLQILLEDTPFRYLRVYDAQENTDSVLRVIKANDLPFKVMLGAWLDAEVSNPNCPWHPQPYPDEQLEENKRTNAEEVQRVIRLANEYPDIVAAVAVGNEALVSWNDHMVPVEQVIDYVRTVKAAVDQPVTVCDNFDWWARHGEQLASELDFVSVHVYPLWEEKGIDEGLSYSIENMIRVQQALPESRLVITEAGWADHASEFADRASQENQQRYYRELMGWARDHNVTTFFFEAFDESWKGDPNNPSGAEKHWGLYFEDRAPKRAIADLTDEERHPD